MGVVGLEPTAIELKAQCSSIWAIHPFQSILAAWILRGRWIRGSLKWGSLATPHAPHHSPCSSKRGIHSVEWPMVEIIYRWLSGGGIEPPTQGFSVLCSNQLSYPDHCFTGKKGFEPLIPGSKFRCFATKLLPTFIIQVLIFCQYAIIVESSLVDFIYHWLGFGSSPCIANNARPRPYPINDLAKLRLVLTYSNVMFLMAQLKYSCRCVASRNLGSDGLAISR